MRMEKYTENDIITCYRSDSHSKMRPEAFLDMAQQMAVKGAQLLPFNDKALLEKGCVWVLARMKAVFDRDVPFDTKVTLDTWHKGQQGLYFLRDYTLSDHQGVAVRSTSSWIVMNVQTRSLSRDEDVMKLLSVAAQSSDNAIEQACSKIIMPRGAEASLIGKHRVRYSDIDKNGHTNNVKYTVWALDSLPSELVMGKRLKELSINFNKEALLDEEVELFHCIKEDGAHIIEGKSEGHQVFIEELVFE